MKKSLIQIIISAILFAILLLSPVNILTFMSRSFNLSRASFVPSFIVSAKLIAPITVSFIFKNIFVPSVLSLS